MENKMGVMPIKRLIITMSLPIMCSMLVQALYNVVDSVFVARLSEDALTAVTLAFPLQNLMIGVGAGTGVGVNAMLSRALGEKNFEKSDAAANTGVLLAFLSGMVFLLVGLFGAEAFIKTQTSDAVISEYGATYLGIVCTFSVGLFFQICFERLLQSTGKTVFSMMSQMTGAVVNIILDPVMIFGLFGCPAFGVAGAAYATVIGQSAAAILALFLNLRHNREITLKLSRILRPKAEYIRRIYAVGVPSILMMAIGSVMTYCMNRILITFSTTATAVFGAYFKLQSFFFMPVIGLNNGVIPVVAYNYGAGSRERINQAISFALRLAVTIMLIGLFIFETVPGTLLRLFDASEEMIVLGIPAMRIIALHFPIAAVCIVILSVFQALSVSYYSLFVSIGRQLVILIPAAWLLSKLGRVNLIWLAFPIAETVSVTIALIFFKRVYGRIIQPLGAAPRTQPPTQPQH